MKKIITVLLGVLTISGVLQAQQKQAKFFAQLATGPSFPIGKFADKSYKAMADDNEPAGLAKMGLNTQLSLGYYLNENVGLLFLPGYSIHAQDESGYESFLIKSITAAGGASTSRVDVEAKSWNILKLMAGGFLVTPLTSEEELVLMTKVTLGACKTAVPSYSFKAYDQNGMSYGSGTANKTSLPWAFCYQISMGLKYKLNNKWHLLVDVSSFNGTPKKEYTFPSSTIVKYKLAEVNTLVGVGIDF